MKDTKLRELTELFLTELDNVFVTSFNATKLAMKGYSPHLFWVGLNDLNDPSFGGLPKLGRLYKSHLQLCEYLELSTLIQDEIHDPNFDECQNKYYDTPSKQKKEPELTQLVTKILRSFDQAFYHDWSFTSMETQDSSYLFEYFDDEDPYDNHNTLGGFYVSHKNLCKYLGKDTLLHDLVNI